MKIKKTILEIALDVVRPALAKNELIEQTTSFCFLKGNIITYNDEISIRYPIDIDFEGALSAPEFYAFVKKVKTDEITVEISDNEILLKSGRIKAGLKLQTEIILPIGEIGEIGDQWKKLPNGFAKALKRAMGCCSRNMSEPVLTGVHIKDTIIEASDGFRVIQYNLENKVPITETLIPANNCTSIINIKPTYVLEGKGWLHFKNKDEVILSSRIIEDKYPNTTKFLNIKGNTLIFPENTIDILDRAGIFSKRDHVLDEMVECNFSNKKLMIKSTSDSGWFEERAKTDYTGEDISFSVTPYLLRDILEETNKAKLSQNILSFEGTNWKYVSMLRGE